MNKVCRVINWCLWFISDLLWHSETDHPAGWNQGCRGWGGSAGSLRNPLPEAQQLWGWNRQHQIHLKRKCFTGHFLQWHDGERQLTLTSRCQICKKNSAPMIQSRKTENIILNIIWLFQGMYPLSLVMRSLISTCGKLCQGLNVMIIM